MAERISAERRLREAQNLAISQELLGFCELQRQFVTAGEEWDRLRESARVLAREARRRMYQPEVILLAIRIGGGVRSDDLVGDVDAERGRFTAALDELLTFYHGSESRPAERRLAPREKKDR